MSARPLHIRGRHQLPLDALALLACIVLAYTLRFEGFPTRQVDIETAWRFAAIIIPINVAIFLGGGLYRRIWRYASIAELERILLTLVVTSVTSFLLGSLALPLLHITPVRVPLSVLALASLLSVLAIAGPRFAMRVVYWHSLQQHRDNDRRAVIAGAGAAGQMIAKELLANPRMGILPVAFVDDDTRKVHHRVHGIPVLGGLEDIRNIAHEQRARVLVIAMPSVSGSTVRHLVNIASATGLKPLILAPFSSLLSEQPERISLRDVQIEDLLRRAPVEVDSGPVRNLAHGRTVLVTGAGGSIGSELCRQLSALHPARLILLGHGENSIFDIQHELLSKFPMISIVPVIADVRDKHRIMTIFDDFRPYAVFHAAAHKHVPLMEENVVEAITNNVEGTRNVVNAALASGTEHFVLISTDKAVRPTSVMGASKRLAERIVQHAATASGNNFVSVRFGNVLGSRGSVVPTFLNQIRTGGPVTVTHPDMRRYFMTIPESVQLVLQAGALGRGGEVFVLDMGEPVKIADLAADLIRLCGLEVGTDIEIKFTGMRPGEKLYEEMFFHEENATPTDHPKVLRAKKAGLPDGLIKLVDRLIAASKTADAEELREMLIALVPDFLRQPGDVAETIGAADLLGRRRTGQYRINNAAVIALADSAPSNES